MYLSLTPVSISLPYLFRRSGLKNAKDKNEKKKNTNTSGSNFAVNKDAIAVTKAANAKLRKNMLGINSSNKIKIIPQITINSHKTIKLSCF